MRNRWYFYIEGVDGWHEIIEAHEDTDKVTAFGVRFKHVSRAASYCMALNRERTK